MDRIDVSAVDDVSLLSPAGQGKPIRAPIDERLEERIVPQHFVIVFILVIGENAVVACTHPFEHGVIDGVSVALVVNRRTGR